MDEIKTSRSGAVFIALSDWILEQGGAVYGVGYEDHFRVVHKRATNREERNEFKGSKYVQSDLKDTFLQIKKDLKKGYKVMFSGTPCQTSGLLSYLKLMRQDISRLYVVDLVCHGVPAPYVWRDYLKYIEKKYQGEVTSFNFRDKSQLGWTTHKESFRIGDKYICMSTYSDLFGKCIMFRHSCGICPFANLKRPSDLTIGDFWGWERVDKNLNVDNKGISLLLVNTEKGHDLFLEIVNQVYYLEADTQHCLQPNLEHPSLINPLRVDFEQDFISRGFVYCVKKYGNIGIKHRIFCFLRKVKYKLLK
jgi:coenzyme F420-reducing hydrogenase beta subunit